MHSELTELIYQKFELLDLIYLELIMRIPDESASSSGKPSYIPSTEEIKLGARAFASMPFSIFALKNPIVNVDNKFTDILFSVSGYFIALGKIID